MNVRVLACGLAVTVLLGGCASPGSDGDVPRPLVVVLFDVSRSTRDPEIRARYREAFVKVLDEVAAQDGILVGDVIDHNPLAHASYPITAAFDRCDPFADNRLECDARDRTTRDEAVVEADTILAEIPERTGTDIHDGVRLAERVFAAYPEATSRYLVLLSDMVEFTPTMRVTSRDFDPTAALEAITSGGDVPDLRGVQVYVVGAGIVATRDLPPERILAIETFWQGFFAAAGAELPDEGFGPALLRFP